MRLTVLSVAYPMFPVTSASSGGAEQILLLLDKALVKTGHQSLVLAAEGSQVAGELISTEPTPKSITDCERKIAQRIHRQRLLDILAERPVDLIHFHGLDFLSYRPSSLPPAQLATLHLPVDRYPPDLFRQNGLTTNCVSRTQAASCSKLRLPIISNGIDLNRFTFNRSKSENLLWLGRVCPEKGTAVALRVAQSLNLPLTVAGPVHPFGDHQNYFREEVAPLLDDRRCYVGPVDNQTRATLLAGARCLLIPSLAAETSSLVAMEAAASGTPVVAFGSGALPEIVEQERTGWIVESEEEMAAAILRCNTIDPLVCRQSAERRFSCRLMENQYLDLYQSLVSSTFRSA